jgi:ADP-ribose pyrophosphatase
MRKVIPGNAVLIPEKAKKVFEGVIHDVYQWPQELFDGTKTTFEMLKRADSATVLAIVDGKIVALKEEQPHRGAKHVFPTGRVEPSDGSVLAAAQRELLEETGYEFINWRLVDVIQPATKIEWFVSAYIAWGVKSRSVVKLDAGEKITVELCDLEEARQIVAADKRYMIETYELLESVKAVADLQHLPKFEGQEVDR